MGSNFSTCGYISVEAFTDGMKESEDKHLEAFVSFLKLDMGGRRLTSLKNKDFLNFAIEYNGSNEAQTNPAYHERLAEKYNSLTAAQ